MSDNPFIDLLKVAKEMMPSTSDHTVSINMGEDFLKVRLYWFNGGSYENTSIQLSLVELAEAKFDLLQHANIMIQRKLEAYLMEKGLEQAGINAKDSKLPTTSYAIKNSHKHKEIFVQSRQEGKSK